MRLFSILFLICLHFTVFANPQDTTKRFVEKIIPNNIVLQFAGNTGMFSTGIRYVSPNKHWKGTVLYGFVPAQYADDPIHSITLKSQYSTYHRKYSQSTSAEWLNIGLWYNHSFGNKYFSKLPHYYDSGYYYFPTATNVGLTLGSELKYKKWGVYYDFGTTDKRVINYVKSLKSIYFREIWNIGIGLVYHI